MHFGNTCRLAQGVPGKRFKIKKMEIKKTSFIDLKKVLSRDEMKKIKGGSGCEPGPCSGPGPCGTGGCGCTYVSFPDGSGDWFCVS